MKPSLLSGSMIALVLLSGCADLKMPSLPSLPKAAAPAADAPVDPNKQYWAKYDHSLQPAAAPPSTPLIRSAAAPAPAAATPAVVAPADAVRMSACAEPSQDATLKLISSLEASVARPASGKQGNSAEFDASVVRLAERAQMLAFLRESMYRTCERAASGQITKDEASAAYGRVMDSVHSIIETDRDRAKESAAKALKELSPEQIRALK
ncbi:MAG TPA: hypothetical protein VIO81_16625 [Methyloversatilis sp.]